MAAQKHSRSIWTTSRSTERGTVKLVQMQPRLLVIRMKKHVPYSFNGTMHYSLDNICTFQVSQCNPGWSLLRPQESVGNLESFVKLHHLKCNIWLTKLQQSAKEATISYVHHFFARHGLGETTFTNMLIILPHKIQTIAFSGIESGGLSLNFTSLSSTLF